MTSIDLLAVASALAHDVPGAELRLRCAEGDAVVVGRRPDANLSPCALRSIIEVKRQWLADQAADVRW